MNAILGCLDSYGTTAMYSQLKLFTSCIMLKELASQLSADIVADLICQSFGNVNVGKDY